MKTKKIFISTILCFTLILCSINSVKANVGTGIIAFFNLFHSLENGEINNLLDFIDQTFQNSGLLGPKIPGDLQTLEDYVHENYPELEGETSQETHENVTDYLTTNISVDDNSQTYTFNNNSRSFFLNLASYYEDQFEYYQGYTLDLSGWDFSGNPTFVNLIKDNQDDNYLLWFNNITGYNGWRLLCIPKIEANDSIRFFYTGNVNNNDDVKLCKITNALNLTTDPRNLFQNCTVYNGNGTIITSGDNFSTTSVYFAMKTGLKSTDFSLTGSQFWLVSYDKSYSIIVHKTVEGLENSEEGIAPYYFNNSVWQDFSTSTGDYTVSSSNINTVTYGDTVSYINDYHDTNNNYPDNSTVNTWIETTNNNNNSGDDSGGGSGGSGDDSGGSGSGIVSILTALGKAIADLITGIAAFLAEVVGGLVEAITGLLDTLTDLITNFTESIPNIFSPLLGWLFDGLPEEFTAIILLGLTACVIASIIKILRG